jgi:hypothetical protein
MRGGLEGAGHQGPRQILKILERVSLRQLYAGKVDAVDAGLLCEPLLRPSPLHPQMSDSAGESFRGRRWHRTSTL